jgi:phenylpropionate dioxygenase-like ring-hydroxylating dioxygenase large terminal subunit
MVSMIHAVEFDLAYQLPGTMYDDDRVFTQEMTSIFQHSWQYVGRVEQVDEPGRYFTTAIGQEPLAILRAASGQLRAFHNVCPHRGSRLLDGAGACGKLIVCPYHAWSFEHDGTAHKIPKQDEYFPALELSQVTLAPAAVEQWRGFVFANPDPDAEPLTEYLAGFPAFLDGYGHRYEDLRQIACFRYDEQVNWKILVENYVEDYHFGFVHPRTLKVFDFEHVQTLPTGRHTRVLMPYRQQPPSGACKYPWDDSGPSYQGYVFPGTTFQTAKNHVSLFRITPISATRTVIEVPVFQTPEQAEQDPLDLAELYADVTSDMEEDFVVCRQLQVNVRSSRYRIGALAIEHERGVGHFQRTWRQYMHGVA